MSDSATGASRRVKRPSAGFCADGKEAAISNAPGALARTRRRDRHHEAFTRLREDDTIAAGPQHGPAVKVVETRPLGPPHEDQTAEAVAPTTA
jgi:hypothetical protein